MLSPMTVDVMHDIKDEKVSARLLLRPDCAVALGFGLGLMPWMPGTFGGLLAFPLCWAMQGAPAIVMVATVAAAVALGVWVSGSTCRHLGVHDHGAIVWDEVCGALIAMLLAPAAWLWWLAAFIAFRAFDILKPWPINWLDRNLKGGWGVMMDDVAAGLAAGALIWLIVRMFALQ
jgi:phosphatidylglycerophosphatase A